jgi:hypothetical protein
VGEFSVDEFLFEFQSDDEEEHRHQPVVDPVPQIQVQPR